MMGMSKEAPRLCTVCMHMSPNAVGFMCCVLERAPTDNKPVICSSRRMFGATDRVGGCGKEGSQWELRSNLDVATADVMADFAASFWLKAAVIETLARDPLDALVDAEALVEILRGRFDQACQKLA
jgi:hypothetical protein